MALEGQEVLVASFADVRHFVSILRTVAFKPRVRMQMLAAGLCFETQESHILQAKAYVPVDVFTTFEFNPPPAPRDERASSVDSDGPPPEELPPSMSIEINLSHLLECLDIFRSAKAAATGPTKKDADDSLGGGFRGKAPTWADDDDREDDDDDGGDGGWRKGGKGGSIPQKVTSARLEWGGEGEQLKVLLSEQGGGPTTECFLSTFDPDETEGLDFENERDEDSPALQIILQSDHLKKQLQSLEPSSDRITLSSRAPGIIPHPSASGSSSSSAFPHSYLSKRTPQGSDGGRKKRKSKDPGADFLIEADGNFETCTMLTLDKKPYCINLDRRVDHIKHQYKKHLLLRSLRALGYSHKSSLSMHESGLFVLQVMMSQPPPSLDPRAMGPEEKEKRRLDDARRKTGDITDGIVEFMMMALSPEDEEREMSGDGSSS